MTSSTPNINPETLIPYGIINVSCLHPELVDDLMYVHGKDLTYENAWEEALNEAKSNYESALEMYANGELDEEPEEFDEDAVKDAFNESYRAEEPTVEGTHEGVKYRTTWVGGALNFFIFQSPIIWECRQASLCVPNAGNLDQLGEGHYEAYGVPVDWLGSNFIEEMFESSGFVLCDFEGLYGYRVPENEPYPKCDQGYDTADEAMAAALTRSFMRSVHA